MNGFTETIDTEGGLEKFETVMTLHQQTDRGATFKSERGSEGRGDNTWLTIGADDFKKLGSPSTVTVRVRPGNTLEEERALAEAAHAAEAGETGDETA